MNFFRSILLMFCLAGLPVFADDATTPGAADVTAVTADAASQDAVIDNPSWLLVACGLPGDDEHRERLTTAVEQIMAAAESVLKIPAEHVVGLAGDEMMRDVLEAKLNRRLKICTRESFQNAAAELCQSVPADADCWIILLGHADLYDHSSRFNVQGADWDQTEMATWLKPLVARRQIIFVTTPVSGFWLKPLGGPNRIVISATEADQEYTGTEMPYALADVLAGQGEHENLRDIDGDGVLSLLDLYVVVNLEIHERFKSIERLQTEHAQLDDNGDGRGSEVQAPYIPLAPPEEDDEAEASSTDTGSPPTPKPITSESLDGYRSRQTWLGVGVEE